MAPYQGTSAIEMTGKRSLQDKMMPNTTQPLALIWTGYSKGGRHFLDKKLLYQNAAQQMVATQQYYIDCFSKSNRLARKWILCQKPVILFGHLDVIPLEAVESQEFPHETQYNKFERSETLTRGLDCPATLRDLAGFFHENKDFHVANENSARRVLFIAHCIDRKRLLIPLSLTVAVMAIAAIIVGVRTHSASTGAAIDGSIGWCVGAILTLIIWAPPKHDDIH